MTIDRFLSECNVKVGLSPARIMQFHNGFVKYLASKNPVFYVRGSLRRTVITTRGGLRIAPTDNSPAWWAYGAAQDPTGADWKNVPTHMFDAMKHGHAAINKKRCYVAHIVPAKQKLKDYESWTRDYATARFICNVHPINHFYVPIESKDLAEKPIVIAHAAGLAQRLQGSIWEEFLHYADDEALSYLRSLPATSPADVLPASAPTSACERVPSVARTHVMLSNGIPTYARSRLTFLANVIEPLGWDDRFRVETPHGVFEFSKREFYSAFPQVPQTKSYRIDGNYNSANLHTRGGVSRWLSPIYFGSFSFRILVSSTTVEPASSGVPLTIIITAVS